MAQKNSQVTNDIKGKVALVTGASSGIGAATMRMELAPKYKIRVTAIQPGAVATELYDHITDKKYRKEMDDLSKRMTFLKSEDIANSILYALQQPAYLDVSEIFLLPSEQEW